MQTKSNRTIKYLNQSELFNFTTFEILYPENKVLELTLTCSDIWKMRMKKKAIKNENLNV